MNQEAEIRGWSPQPLALERQLAIEFYRAHTAASARFDPFLVTNARLGDSLPPIAASEAAAIAAVAAAAAARALRDEAILAKSA